RCYRDWSSDVCSSDLGGRVPAGRGAGAAGRGGAAAAVADLSGGAGRRRAGRRADGGFGRGSDLAGPGGRERVRGGAGFGAVVVRSEERRVGKEGELR